MSSKTGVPFRWAHSGREAPSVRIRFFGVRGIEGMGEFLHVRSTLVCSFFLYASR